MEEMLKEERIEEVKRESCKNLGQRSFYFVTVKLVL